MTSSDLAAGMVACGELEGLVSDGFVGIGIRRNKDV